MLANPPLHFEGFGLEITQVCMSKHIASDVENCSIAIYAGFDIFVEINNLKTVEIKLADEAQQTKRS